MIDLLQLEFSGCSPLWWQEQEAAGHIALEIREKMNTAVPLVLVFLFSPEP